VSKKKIESLLSNEEEFSCPHYAGPIVHNNNSLEADKEWQYMNENGSTRVIRELV
jgi:hypothetical protein